MPSALEAIPSQSLDEYHDLFATIDQDGSGDVTTAELREIFVSTQIRVAEQELRDIIEAMDTNGTGTVTFVGERAAALARVAKLEPRHGTAEASASYSHAPPLADAEFASVMHALVLSRREVGNPEMYAPPAAAVLAASSIDDAGSRGGMTGWISSAAAHVAWARAATWDLMDDPGSSPMAQLISWWILAAITVSVATFVAETIPGLHRRYDEVFDMIELVCIVHFLAEFGLRLLSCPSQVAFWTDTLNLVDFAAILPFFAELVLQSSAQGTSVLRAVRLVRVFRVIKVSRYLAWLRVFAATVVASVAPLGMILFVIMLAVILLSSAVYFIERGVTRGFDSIPEAMWWCVITMTTIGFGRVTPGTLGGKLIAAVAAISGVIILAIPISVIATNFQIEFAKLTTSRAAVAKTQESQAEMNMDEHASKTASAQERGSRDVPPGRWCASCYGPGSQMAAAPDQTQDPDINPIVESVVSKIQARHSSLGPGARSSHWSAGILRTSLDAVLSNRRRLMSNLKQVELRNRDEMIDEAAALVLSVDVKDRGQFLASLAERELF